MIRVFPKAQSPKFSISYRSSATQSTPTTQTTIVGIDYCITGSDYTSTVVMNLLPNELEPEPQYLNRQERRARAAKKRRKR